MIYFKDLGNYGRLGNQLFQISTTISLSIENDDIAVFPIWEYNKYLKTEINSKCLENFNIKSEYNDSHFSYSKIPYSEGMNLNGYFQSEKYFIKHKDLIIDMFILKDEYSIPMKNRWLEILKTSTVSMHIRRGDYLEKQDFHPCPSVDYFNKSLEYIESLNYIDNILVFSDDIQWCKDNLKDNRCIFIEDQNEIEDMFLMSYCNHNIITNSSFSWWGSWLNKNENKIVCAPQQWFGINGYSNWSDIYCDKMIIIK